MKISSLVVLFYVSNVLCGETSSDEDSSHSHNVHHSHKHSFKEMFYWDNIEFEFPNDCAKNQSLSSGSYVPRNNNIWGIGVWKNKIFASVFRHGPGISSSLNYFLINSTTKSPLLIPYPSFEANFVNEAPGQRTTAVTNNSTVICATYFRIDKCDRLWIIDAGIADFFGEHRSVTPPAIIIFDLNTDQLIRRYTIPEEFVNSFTLFTCLDVDFTGNDCDDVHAYVIDLFRSIVVYSFKKNRSWRFTHNLLGSDPEQAYFSIGSLHFSWNYGAYTVTVGERHRDGSRRVYVNPIASTKSYYISNKILQNETYIAMNDYYRDVHLLGDRGQKGQILSWAYDEKTNVLFDTQFYRGQITCWNSMNRYTASNFGVVFRKKHLFFPTDVDIDRNRNLWIVSNNAPTYLYGTWEANVKNIRIFKAKVDDIITGTVCNRRMELW